MTNLATLTAAEAALGRRPGSGCRGRGDSADCGVARRHHRRGWASITAARAAYDGLTAAQQALVTNLATLTAAEAALAAAQDQAAADAVTAKIAGAAPPSITAADGPAITAARAAYDGLTAAQQRW